MTAERTEHGLEIAKRLGKTQRWLQTGDLPQPGKVKGKRGVCRWCLGKLAGRRRSWCSEACVEAFYIRSSGQSVRWRLKKRDAEVCAGCGLDCAALDRWLLRLLPVKDRWGKRWYRSRGCRGRGCDCRWHRARADLIRRGFNRGGFEWEADHIVPVTEGGGCCGLDNYRTLCVPCHKGETKALAGRTAEFRRTAKLNGAPLPLFDESEDEPF